MWRENIQHVIYRKYFENPTPENMPLLEDLYNALLTQDEPEARHVAAALEIYVKGSLNIFNHHTNVDINNRIVCFDIKQLGKQLKKLGMITTPTIPMAAASSSSRWCRSREPPSIWSSIATPKDSRPSTL